MIISILEVETITSQLAFTQNYLVTQEKFAAVLSDYLDSAAVEDWYLHYADYLILN